MDINFLVFLSVFVLPRISFYRLFICLKWVSHLLPFHRAKGSKMPFVAFFLTCCDFLATLQQFP
jgi:hypothetical protein